MHWLFLYPVGGGEFLVARSMLVSGAFCFSGLLQGMNDYTQPAKRVIKEQTLIIECVRRNY